MSLWRDISTAPRDGSFILLWKGDWASAFVAQWGTHGVATGWVFRPIADVITGERQLPEPPQSEGA